MRHSTVFRFVHTWILICLMGSTWSYVKGQVTVPNDTIKNAAKDSIPPSTSPLITTGDTTKKDSGSTEAMNIDAMKAQSDLKSKIDYNSSAYMVLDMEAKTLKLVSQGKINYEDMSLAADTVIMNWETDMLTARGRLDSTGQLVGRPEFEENDQKYRSDSMRYNIATQKGLVFGARTKQEENYILADRVKKGEGDTYYIKNGKFTTCDHEHPHYYIKSNKLKILPKDKIITGPLLLVIEDFPLPIPIPFGFFPNNQSNRQSGVIMPTYGEAPDRGFFLRDGGYYFALSDKMDLTVRGDIFSKGGYRVEVGSSYNKRYRFDGSLTVQYGYQRFGERQDPTFRDTRDFWVNWTHNQKINPQASLTGSVQAGTSSFNENFSYNEQNYLSNTFRSNIVYTQAFANSPWRFTLSGNHSQNTQTSQVTIGFPQLTVNRTRWFPFKGKNSTGNQWYKKIGLNYTMSLQNNITAPDSLIADLLTDPTGTVELVTITGEDTLREFVDAQDYYRNGILHTIPISTQLTLAKFININPSINFREFWYINTLEQTFNESTNSIESNDVNGFFATRAIDFNLSASTRLYGIFQFKGKRQAAIRHTFQPTLGYTFKPDYAADFWNVFREVQSDTLGNTIQYSRFQNGQFGGPSAGEVQSLNLTLNNILELKYKDAKLEADTTKKDKFTRLNILDSFGARASYNFAADSLNLSFISFNARTSVLNNKLAIQMNGSLDPYAVLPNGTRVDYFRWESERKLARLNDITLALSTSLRSGQIGGGNRRVEFASDEPTFIRRPRNLSDPEWEQIQYFRNAFVDFNIPWSLNLNYNLRFSNTGVVRDTVQTFNFSGDFNFTQKWKLGFTSGWDFTAKDFSYTSVTIYRDLHCWEMNMTWIPFGNRQSYNFGISVKSPTLKDLKLTKRRDWQDVF